MSCLWITVFLCGVLTLVTFYIMLSTPPARTSSVRTPPLQEEQIAEAVTPSTRSTSSESPLSKLRTPSKLQPLVAEETRTIDTCSIARLRLAAKSLTQHLNDNMAVIFASFSEKAEYNVPNMKNSTMTLTFSNNPIVSYDGIGKLRIEDETESALFSTWLYGEEYVVVKQKGLKINMTMNIAPSTCKLDLRSADVSTSISDIETTAAADIIDSLPLYYRLPVQAASLWPTFDALSALRLVAEKQFLPQISVLVKRYLTKIQLEF